MLSGGKCIKKADQKLQKITKLKKNFKITMFDKRVYV